MLGNPPGENPAVGREAIATPYDGPVSVAKLCYGAIGLRVLRPADPDRLLENGAVLALNRREDYMPYWAYLWPGAHLLADAVALADAGPLMGAGVEVLEIGCGLGLAGLVAAARGCRVTFTDYDETPLRFVRENLRENGLSSSGSSTSLLDWRSPPEAAFPWILGADVLYERKLVPLVVGVLGRMLAPDGEAWLAGPDRSATEDLEPCLGANGFVWSREAATARDERGEVVRGRLHRVRRR